MSTPSDPSGPPAFARPLRGAVAVAGAALVLVYLAIGASHLRHPHELEWIEGGMVDEVRRLVEGRPLYVKPSVDYVPFIYAPLWFHAAALSAKLFGVGFFSARLVSYLASIAAIALVGRMVFAETRDRVAALGAAGLFAATYPIAAAFYDLARVDSLFLALTLGGLHLVRHRSSVGSAVAAGALFALAFFTKQSAPLVLAPVALQLLFVDRRRGLAFAAAAGGLMLGGVLLYERASGGWFWHFVFTLPAHHEIVKRQALAFVLELGTLLGVASALGVAYLVLEKRRAVQTFYLAAAAGMMLAALAGRLHLGGWSNVLAPAYAILAVLFGLGLHAALTRAPTTTRAAAITGAVLVAALLQLLQRGYDPRAYLAAPANAAAWDGLVAAVRAAPGDAFVPAHGFVGPRAGKPAHAHQMALSDELRAGGPGAGELRKEILAAVAEKRFSLIVTDNDFPPRQALEKAYAQRGPVPARGALAPVIGWQVARPQLLWEPKP